MLLTQRFRLIAALMSRFQPVRAGDRLLDEAGLILIDESGDKLTG